MQYAKQSNIIADMDADMHQYAMNDNVHTICIEYAIYMKQISIKYASYMQHIRNKYAKSLIPCLPVSLSPSLSAPLLFPTSV